MGNRTDLTMLLELPFIVAYIIVIGLIVAIYFLFRPEGGERPAPRRSDPLEPVAPIPSANPAGPESLAAKKADDIGVNKADTPPAHYHPPQVTTPTPNFAEMKKVAAGSPKEGAERFAEVAHWREAALFYKQAGDTLAAAELFLALGDNSAAEEEIKKSLQTDPDNDKLREKYLAVLIDNGKIDEARDFAMDHLAESSPADLTAASLGAFGRSLESCGEITMARNFYEKALLKDPRIPELPERLLYLSELEKLADKFSSEEYNARPATELLNEYIRESTSQVLSMRPHNPADFEGREVIVGHLALGFQQSEPKSSVRSNYSTARRFQIKRQLSNTIKSAVFEVNDELLDFSAVLKLVRLPEDSSYLAILRERLKALAKLNHPSLAKITYADRHGTVLRVATEFLPGGNLKDFLHKIGAIGRPLMMRIAMHLASALHAAHLKGLPHGDLRPENILMGTDQRFKLSDFALSPIPVKYVEYKGATVSDTGETPQTSEFVIRNEGILSDLYQFADVLDFMLPFVRADSQDEVTVEEREELNELIRSLRSGGFTSVLRLWQVLEQMYERSLPPNSKPNSGG